MRIVLIVFALGSSLLFQACKSSKKSNSTGASGNDANNGSAQVTVPAKNEGPTYDMIVSFFSIGAGTDGKGKQQLRDFITNFENDKKVTVKYEDFAWGREGEEDFCFTFTNLSPELKEKFVVNIKDMFLGNQLVRVGENEKFVHNRK